MCLRIIKEASVEEGQWEGRSKSSKLPGSCKDLGINNKNDGESLKNFEQSDMI